MMRPMKLGGQELMFGEGCLKHLKTLKGSKAMIVTGGSSMKKSGILQMVIDYLKEAGIESDVFSGVEPDPLFSTVISGARKMKEYKPDIIIGLGGGSAMDAAKAMWIYYENEDLKTLKDILPPNAFPKLRKKAYLVCIPSTSGTASEVSRSIVITQDETHTKFGIGNMEMMPDIAICDPVVTATMPSSITAETGMDALTHALEAWASNRANYVSDILAQAAVKDIVEFLPKTFEDGSNLEYRERMLNASMLAGMAFTNVSLGIVHSMSHTLGSLFGAPHGLLNSILLPYVLEFNSREEGARNKYTRLGKSLLGGADKYAALAKGLSVEEDKYAVPVKGISGEEDKHATLAKGLSVEVDLIKIVKELNAKVKIPSALKDIIPNKEKFEEKIEVMINMALADGCTKTNPIIPSAEELRDLFFYAYYGKR